MLLSLRSREEFELWKEKQRQVKKEEENFVNLKAAEMIKGRVEKRETGYVTTVISNNNWMAGRQEIDQIKRREIWIQQAAVFIKQVY